MSSLAEDIKAIILKALPSLSKDTQLQLISTFFSSGVESVEDLKYVKQEDIKDLLPVIQQRKLLETLILETTTVKLDLQDLPSDSTYTSLSPLSSPPTAASSSSSRSSSSYSPSSQPSLHDPSSTGPSAIIPKTWPETFQVPWEKMPKDIQSAIANGKRPAPVNRRQMVRIVADEIRTYEANPTRSQCLTICRHITGQYPNSFADMTSSGDLIAGGFTSLLSQVKTQIENINRYGSFKRLRSSGRCGIAGHKRGSTDTYGCTQFQPEFPPEETNETVEEKRQMLENIYRQDGIHGGETGEALSLMETTFCLQRRYINEIPVPSIDNLRSKWPYLFTQRGIYAHFELLTDVPVLHILELSIQECGKAIVQYFRGKKTNKDVQNVLSQGEDIDPSLLVIQLLMAHFAEKAEALMFHANESATAADVESTLTLPASPHLILFHGDQIMAPRWMVSMEGQIICEGVQPTFISGLAAMFATFYIFNLQYQDEATKTLEFIQRRFIGINPERGTKASQGKTVSKKTGRLVQKKVLTVNPHVATLLKNLMDFEWDFIQ